MALDSPAAFNNRVGELGLDTHVARFITAGWLTLADLAFASSFVPGGDENAFVADIVVVGLGSATHADKAKLRRLFFEAYTLAAADLRRRMEANSDDLPRKIPGVEREERRKRLADRLVGFELKDELDCSHKLIDKCIVMAEENVLSYISIEVCTKRAMELMGHNKDPMWTQVPDAAGVMRIRPVGDDEYANLDSQFALGFAFQRRSLALEMGDLVTYESMEKLSKALIAAIMKKPLPGYRKVSVAQALAADQVAWQLVASETRAGIRRRGLGNRPLDDAFDLAIKHEDFTLALRPLQGSETHVPPPRHHAADEHDDVNKDHGRMTRGQKRKLKQQERSAADSAGRRQATVPPNDKGKGKGSKDKGAKGKGTGKGPTMPAGLVGMIPRSSVATGSKRLCFAFHLGGCPAAAAGGECPQGWHLCVVPVNGEACSKAHTKNQHA